ncbi:serine protease [Streptomyces sp. NBC_00249]|uniref:trypsin-like serine peptidase n=1 Tax=Streptomyces sp. NBC_00249 TaxID=2975690 RepID=UPI00225157C5|nr:serine protease [Streptomyces sp. NBC_00249]MCX5197125.1 serine protease [Streptomyces sp. NBC_00249]
MIQRNLPRPAGRSRARRASRILLALTAMAALVSVDVPDAAAVPPLGVTVEAVPDTAADRVGALFAGGLDGGHFCTASVVRSAGRDLIATAAHCLGHPEGTVFVPGYRDGKAPYGVWRLTGVRVSPAWTDGVEPDADLAFATLAPLDGVRVEDVVGGFPVAGRQPEAVTVTVLGYPSAQEAPLRCANTTSLFTDTQRRIDCPELSGGTSGSPWLAGGALAGVLGGYEGGGTVPEVSYSAVMGDAALELYREAAGGAGGAGGAG